MSDYRICFNSAPHCTDWWTVEKRKVTKRRQLFRRPVEVETWEAAFDYREWVTWCGPMVRLSTDLFAYRFKTREEAEAWVAEDQKPRVHRCEAA